MSLTLGLDIASSSLRASAANAAVASRNVANAGDPSASRKIASMAWTPGGGVRLAAVTRAADASLHEKLLSATSSEARLSVMSRALERLSEATGAVDDEGSPAALAGKLRDALQTYADAPGDALRGQAVVTAAHDLARSLNSASAATQTARAEADAKIAEGVARVNELLADFAELNAAIVTGSRAGRDMTADMDRRDAVLKSMAEQIDIRTMTRADGDMAIFTAGGLTLFATTPRTLSFTPTPLFTAATAGAPVYVDGVPATQGGPLAIGGGAIAGHVELRDALAPVYQSQLDEMARGLIALFRESDVSATPSQPDAAGLFTYGGAPAIPTAGAASLGLAADIRVADRADPARGGDPSRIRDGGVSNPGDPAFVANPSGAAGYSTRLLALIDGFEAPAAFDPAAQLGDTASLLEFAASSVGWFEGQRQTAEGNLEFVSAQAQRVGEAHANAVGVNLDDELARLLEIERAYQASAKLLSSIDSMYGALFQAIR
ncbi:MAG: flagellar hook-associated protein FlgK [Hyphomicrobiales bacterium]|nr:flagellar hook-associated protein FlgK [Hyphomicrobiales bacterium]